MYVQLDYFRLFI